MEQVVRTYPSPVSPLKPAKPDHRPVRDPRGGVQTPPSRLSPHRLPLMPRRSPPRQNSPAPDRGVEIGSPVKGESRITDRQVEKTQKQLNQLKGKYKGNQSKQRQ